MNRPKTVFRKETFVTKFGIEIFTLKNVTQKILRIEKGLFQMKQEKCWKIHWCCLYDAAVKILCVSVPLVQDVW